MSNRKSVELFVWMRLGDSSDYERHDDVTSAAGMMHEAGVKGPLRRGTRGRGKVFAPGYESRNYISLFWGDRSGDYVKNLTKAEIREVEKVIVK